MFVNADALLKAQAMRFSQVVRTWIYLPNISRWYREFNQVRTKFFKEHQIGNEQMGNAFPASTGIEGRSGAEECIMDVLGCPANAIGKLPSARFCIQAARNVPLTTVLLFLAACRLTLAINKQFLCIRNRQHRWRWINALRGLSGSADYGNTFKHCRFAGVFRC